ncbi:MAG: 50S ribosomal protein L9 [Candidatus Bipolaricaulia bacterium]
MEVLLTRTVDKLGEPGDVVDVAPGYARNYLLPQGVAVQPTPHNVERYKSVREARMQELKARKDRAQDLQQQLDGKTLVFERRTNDQGTLYSSVQPGDIAKELNEHFGTELEAGRVEMHEHIETPGEYHATINLYMDITAAVTLQVVAEGEEAPMPEPEEPETVDEEEAEAIAEEVEEEVK